MNRQQVLVLGNPIEKSDRFAVKLLPSLRKKFPLLDFIHFDPTEELPQNIIDEELIIIDTVVELTKVTKFKDLNQWAISPRVTVHDYDLPLSLGILKKLGKIKKVTIIGIPAKGGTHKSFKEVVKILTASGI